MEGMPFGHRNSQNAELETFMLVHKLMGEIKMALYTTYYAACQWSPKLQYITFEAP